MVIIGGLGARHLIRLASNLMLTRLLVPEAFGLMAAAMSINIWVNMLTDIGIKSSVIRSKNSDDPEFLRTAWTMRIMRDLIIWTIICVAAGAIYILVERGVAPPESIFANPALPWVMIAISLQFPINALYSMNRTMAERRLAMRRVVSLEIIGQIVTTTFCVAFAILGYGVWSLVIGSIAGSLFGLVNSYLFFPGPRMGLRLNRAYFSEVFHFGKWLIIASFFGFMVSRGDQILFGWLMDSARFSLYAVATIWVIAASAFVQTAIQRIFFPAIGEILRERPERATAVYRQARLIVDALVTVIAFGAFFLAEPVFRIIYTEDFAPVGYYVKLLAPMFLFLPYRLINNVVLAAGDSKGFTAVTVVSGLTIAAVAPLVFTTFGEKFAILAFACAPLAALPIVWRLGGKIMEIDIMVEGRMLCAVLVLVAMLIVSP